MGEDEHTTESDVPSRIRYCLVVSRPDGQAHTYELGDRPISIGRAVENDINVREGPVSRLHCVVSLVGGRPSVLDQGSSNGTFVNGKRVSHAWLEHDDVIKVGLTSILVEAMEMSGTFTPVPTTRTVPLTPPQLDALTGEAPHAYLQVLYKLGALLAHSVDEKSAAEAVTDLVLEALPVERVWVLRLGEGDPPEATPVAATVRKGRLGAPGGPSQTVIQMTVERGKAVHCFDIAADVELSRARSLTTAQARTVVAAPMRRGDDITGILYADAPNQSDADALQGAVALFECIADQAALALGRARLHHDLLRKNETLRRQRDRLDELSRRLEGTVLEKSALADARATELAVRVAELEQLQRAREVMARGLVHDIRNLVASVSSNLHYLKPEEELDPEKIQAAEDALEGTRQIVSMAEDVLAASRMESGAMELDLEMTAVVGLLGSAVRRLAGRARDLGVDLDVGRASRALVVTVDVGLVSRLLDNIVGNALRHAGRGGRVRLEAVRQGNSVQIAVTDTGPGVPEEERRKIFDEWYRGGGASARHHGIGLHFCHLAVEAHGGRLWVEGESGDNRFMVSLPSAMKDGDMEITISDRPTVVPKDED